VVEATAVVEAMVEAEATVVVEDKDMVRRILVVLLSYILPSVFLKNYSQKNPSYI
jgi:hypothetical protein